MCSLKDFHYQTKKWERERERRERRVAVDKSVNFKVLEASKADTKLLHSSGSLYCYHFLVLGRISSELVDLWINCRLFYFARMLIYSIIKIINR